MNWYFHRTSSAITLVTFPNHKVIKFKSNYIVSYFPNGLPYISFCLSILGKYPTITEAHLGNNKCAILLQQLIRRWILLKCWQYWLFKEKNICGDVIILNKLRNMRRVKVFNYLNWWINLKTSKSIQLLSFKTFPVIGKVWSQSWVSF